jgi:hypothetical protein
LRHNAKYRKRSGREKVPTNGRDLKPQMGHSREGSEEGHGSWCNIIESLTTFEGIPDSKGRLDSVAALRRE